MVLQAGMACMRSGLGTRGLCLPCSPVRRRRCLPCCPGWRHHRCAAAAEGAAASGLCPSCCPRNPRPSCDSTRLCVIVQCSALQRVLSCTCLALRATMPALLRPIPCHAGRASPTPNHQQQSCKQHDRHGLGLSERRQLQSTQSRSMSWAAVALARVLLCWASALRSLSFPCACIVTLNMTGKCESNSALAPALHASLSC